MSHQYDQRLQPVISRKIVLFLSVGWAVILIAGLFLVERYTAAEAQRDTQVWQRQLQLTADSQRRQIEQWLYAQQSVVDGLASNQSLKLYLTEIKSKQGEGGSEERVDEAYITFLSNLLISESSQHGYAEPKVTDAVPANIAPPIGVGLAILDENERLVVSTAAAPRLEQLPADTAQRFRRKSKSPIGPFQFETNSDTFILFYSEVQAIQSDNTQGYIVGVKRFDDEIQELLALPPQSAPSSESYLVAQQQGSLHYLSQLQDGSKPLEMRMDAKTPDLAEAYLMQHPGQFVTMRDYLGQPVLAVGQRVAGTNWLLMHKINAKTAYADTHQRKKTLLMLYVLAAGLITFIFIALWRNVSAARAKQAALHFKEISLAAEKQRHLLTHLTNTLIMLVDSRDPHAQNHSNRVAKVAMAIAAQIHLSHQLQETTALAASLMNVGKIKADEGLLTKKEISAEDKHAIRQSLLASAEILKDIAFEGPVVETLRQSLEHVDGSGPLGLKEEEILLSAKIIAVANAFVAMISERSYRSALTVDEALQEIHQLMDRYYARSVVAALEHYIENEGGREEWSSSPS